MNRKSYRPMNDPAAVTRREFFKTVGLGAAAAGGIVLGGSAFAQEAAKPAKPAEASRQEVLLQEIRDILANKPVRQA